MDSNDQAREASLLKVIANLSDRVHALEESQGLESRGDWYAYCGLMHGNLSTWESGDYTERSDAKTAGNAHCRDAHGNSNSHMNYLQRM